MEKNKIILKLPQSNIKFVANIFYRLMFDSINNKFITGGSPKENAEKFTQTHLFFDLNILTNPSDVTLGHFNGLRSKGTLDQRYKNAASKFKEGIVTAKSSNFFHLNKYEIVRDFDEQVKNEYSKVFVKAVEFSRRYFDDNNPSKNTELIQKILYLILDDDSIDESQEFYICSDGSTKKKSDLRNTEEIEFEAFLLDIWHYLILYRRLQVKLIKEEKTVGTIVVNSEYKKLNVNLTYSDMVVDVEKPTDSQNNADESDVNDINSNDNKSNHDHKENNSSKLRKSRYSAYSGIKDYYEKKMEEEIRDMERDSYLSWILQNINIIEVMENNDITLSRSIFFYLLADAIKTVHPKRNKFVVEKLFIDMVHIAIENDYEIDFERSCVREYRDKFRYLKKFSASDFLDDESIISDFSHYICTCYDEALNDMIKISKKYFNSDEKNETLVVSLIEFIKNDNSIEENQEFYVCSNGSTLTKKQLCEIEELEFESFILGVWHYVISQLTAKDSKDEHTFSTVFKISYTYNGESREIYRSADIIEEQSDMYVELIYLEE